MKEAMRHNENKLRYDLCPAIAQREYAKVWILPVTGRKAFPSPL
jgi:hypothetical protein